VGDVNIAHQEIDLKNWKSNQKNSGFLPEERAWMTKLLGAEGWRPGGRVPPPAPRHHRRLLHVVEQPRPGLCQERGLAAGLPPGHAGAGYRHLDPDDLEDADDLLAEIETLAPPETLAEAVEDLVRSVLLMADVSRPVAGALAAGPRLRPGQRPAHSAPPGRKGPATPWRLRQV
jgi:hypothetical protein